MISLPEEYVVKSFYEYAYFVKHNKYNNTYQASCPVCREGKSFKKQKRCYYIPKNDNIYCHNCGWSSKPLKWIQEVSGKQVSEILEEVKSYDGYRDVSIEEEPVVYKSDTLPKDSINLSDPQQLEFYKHNPIVSAALVLIKNRRLDTAVNKPECLYLSLVDYTHKNRLVIPFKNEKGDIVFYQSRTILPKDDFERPRYIGRIGEEKTLFNIDKVDSSFQSVFIFEGPFNAFFTKNSVAVAGISDRGHAMFTARQQQQADTLLKWYNRIWVLDSQWLDATSLKKTEILLNDGEKCFIWPEKFGRLYKDFNDVCMACKVDEIRHKFIEDNTFEGLEGIVRLTEIKKFIS